MRIIKNIPNTITSMNLLCGLMGVIFTFKGQLDIAFLLMIAAAVCDFSDGLAARLLGAYSDLGKELDSLADMVSFGVLPALMAHKLMTICGTDGVLSFIPLLIAVFSAIRLAEFNIDERQSDNFIGLATPACAMICGSFAYYVCNDRSSMLFTLASCRFFIPAASLVLSYLLISRIPMFSMKFKKNTTSGNPVFMHRIAFIAIILATSIVVLILGLNWSMIVLLTFLIYIIMNISIMLIPESKRE